MSELSSELSIQEVGEFTTECFCAEEASTTSLETLDAIPINIINKKSHANDSISTSTSASTTSNNVNTEPNTLTTPATTTTTTAAQPTKTSTSSTSIIDGEIETIDDFSQLFRDFEPLNFEGSLKALGLKKYKDIATRCNAIAESIECNSSAIPPLNIAVIVSYLMPKEQGPRPLVDEALAISRSKSALKKVRSYFYHLLKALRYLPRYYPGTHRLFCAGKVAKKKMRQQFQQPHPASVMLWSFTIAYERKDALLSGNTCSGGDTTLFVAGGSCAWGYNVSFACDRKDIGAVVIMEPGRQLMLTREQDSEGFLHADVINDATVALDHSQYMSSSYIMTKKEEKSHSKQKENAKPAFFASKSSAAKSTTVGNNIKPKDDDNTKCSDNNIKPAEDGSTKLNDDNNITKLNNNDNPKLNTKANNTKSSKYGDTAQLSTPEGFGVDSTTWNSVIFTWLPIKEDVGLSQTPSSPTPPTVIIWYQIEVRPKGGSSTQVSVHCSKSPRCVARGLSPDTQYVAKLRAGNFCDKTWGKWTSSIDFQTPQKPATMECAWRECPDTVSKKRRYAVSGPGCEIATKTTGSDTFCAVVKDGCIAEGRNYRVRILKSLNGSGNGIYVGVAPTDVDQNSDTWSGWLFNCYFGLLWSGPPHSYRGMEYGLVKKEWGAYVKTGDDITILLDSKAGTLAFSVAGTNLGVAYDRIPLDKPLTIIALMLCLEDSVQLLD